MCKRERERGKDGRRKGKEVKEKEERRERE